MDFILIPLVTWIICTTIYRLFGLFVQRRERIMMIEKANIDFEKTKLSTSHLMDEAFKNDALLQLPKTKNRSFIVLRWGCLAVGLGLGLLVGGLLLYYFGIEQDHAEENLFRYSIQGYLMASCVFLFGGLGLVVSFVLERKLEQK